MSETNAMRRAAEIAEGCTSVAEAAKQIRREALRIDSLNESRADQALLSRAATTQAGENDPCLVKLSCMLQALEFPPAAIAMSGPQLAVVCKEIVAGYKANAPSQPVAWQCAEHGYDDWHEIPKESFGINPQRYKYRELFDAPVAPTTQVDNLKSPSDVPVETASELKRVAPVVPDGYMSSRDTNVDAVREKLRQRSIVGQQKYGLTTERKDLSHAEWLRHAQEEAMDFAVYLEAAMTAAHPAQPSSEQPVMSKSMAKRIAAQCDEPLFTASMYGTAEAALEAREKWLAEHEPAPRDIARERKA